MVVADKTVITICFCSYSFSPKGAGNPRKLITVYRGTDIYMEQQVFDETGHLLSDSACQVYLDGATLEDAYNTAQLTHNQWLDIWGSESNYVQAHGEFGTELKTEFGLPKTMISVTTDLDMAKRFAPRTGMVYKAQVPESELIKQIIEDSGESEYLIKFGSGRFESCK